MKTQITKTSSRTEISSVESLNYKRQRACGALCVRHIYNIPLETLYDPCRELYVHHKSIHVWGHIKPPYRGPYRIHIRLKIKSLCAVLLCTWKKNYHSLFKSASSYLSLITVRFINNGTQSFSKTVGQRPRAGPMRKRMTWDARVTDRWREAALTCL